MLDLVLNSMPTGLTVSTVAWGVALAGAAAGAVCDLREHRLPNALTFPLIVSALAFHAGAGGFSGALIAVAGALIAGFPFAVLWLVAKGGAGDAKMMAAVGAWLGIGHGLVALVCVVIAGAVGAIGVSLLRREGAALARNMTAPALGVAAAARGQIKPSELAGMMPRPETLHRFPYGVAILVGTAVAAAGVTLWHA